MLLDTIPNLHTFVEPRLGEKYATYDCWQLLRDLLKEGWDIDCAEPGVLASQFGEIWFQNDSRPLRDLVQPWDCLVISRSGLVGDHCGLVLDDGSLVHAQPHAGVVIEPLRRWQRQVMQVVRLRKLGCPLAPSLYEDAQANTILPPPGMAMLVLAQSPVRAQDGTVRVIRQPIEAGQSLAACLPPRVAWDRLVWNGGVVVAGTEADIIIQPGDEVWAMPRWGTGIEIGAILIPIVIGLAVSVATTFLSYLLFPPQKQHIDRPEEHTFSFSGIQTATGPGNVVPIIYGRHRVGGQLLSAYIEQALTVVDTGAGTTRVEAITQPPRLNMLLSLGEGPLADIMLSTMEINGQPGSNFLGLEATTRLGLPGQPPIDAMEETRNTFADGRDLPLTITFAEEIIYSTNPTVPLTAFILNIVFNAGLFSLNGKGEKEDNTVNVAYRIRVQGTGPWSDWSVFQVAAARTAPVRFGIRREGLASAAYDISLQYGGIRNSDELRAKWQPTLESVTEIQPGINTYDNTALLALRAVATDALQGALPNITVEVQGRTVRVGTFNPTYEWSDNPAWCIMDFLTNARYGMGIPDSDIDLGAFTQWGTYCDQTIDGEARHRFNYVLDRDGRAQALLMEMMGGSRTILLKSEGLWVPRPTRNDLPVQLLSWSSCTNVRITYTRDPDRINVMEARFANEEDHYQQDVLTWPTVDNWPADVHKASLELRGVTKPSRVMRAMQFELNRRRFENVRLEMDCSLDAVVLQIHDIFRFAHPLPGWGWSGRVMSGSTTTTIYLDEAVTMSSGVAYQLYIKHASDFTEARPVVNPGGTTTHTLTMAVAFQYTPTPRDAVWAFGTATPDGAVKLFRVTSLKRNSDTTVHVEAVIFNPTVVDEPVATALPVTTTLFNPLGPPPPLTFLRATELTRVQPSGASLRVVNLAWDIGPLGPGYAPYAGAVISRRTVLEAGQAGQATAGAGEFGQMQNDGNLNFVQLEQVRGHVLEWDDFTVITGGTYVYRVVPVSQRDIPNEGGALEAVIHVAGPTTPDFYPGSVPNLRLRGKAVGDHIWEGRDVHLEWDASQSPLFNETFFVQDYMVQVWAPAQEYLLRSVFVTAREFHYTYEMNAEDQSRTGHVGARRDLEFWVWARTNTGRLSLDPAHILVLNPPPDMSMIMPDTEDLFAAAIISWDQYVEPRDFDHYEVHLDVMTPPVAIYEDVAIGFHGQGSNFRKVFPQGLIIGQLYYTFILPYDTFGPGTPTPITTLTPFGLDADMVDTTPPGPPTGLVLTTGSDRSADGTIMPWVQARWTPPPDDDVGSFQVHVYIGTDTTNPTVYSPEVTQTQVRFAVPGVTTIRVRVLAMDRFGNMSPFTEEATIVSGGDTVAPGPCANLTVLSDTRAVHLLWTPPPDPDYAFAYVFAAPAGNISAIAYIGTGGHTFTHSGLGPAQQMQYWVQSVDTSGNVGPLHPPPGFPGIPQTAELLVDQFIGSLGADKIIAGTIDVLVRLGVANRIILDGVNDVISIVDFNGVIRAQLGKFGPVSNQWGLRLFNELGQLQWNFQTGLLPPGITDGAITAPAISVGAIQAQHLVTNTAVITGAAQIANAIIGDAHINGLTAGKILTGSLQAQMFIGVGPGLGILLDGPQRRILVYDENGLPRVDIGRLGAGVSDYGMYLWNAAGQLMLDFNTGATEFGIQALAITSAHIRDAAITNAKIANLEVDSAKIANLTVGTGKIANNAVSASIIFVGAGGGGIAGTRTQYASVSLNLDPGDQLWLIGCCTVIGAGLGSGVGLFLQEDSLTGPTLHQAQAQADPDPARKGSMVVQTVYISPIAWVGKTFLLSVQGIGSVADVRLAAFRLRK